MCVLLVVGKNDYKTLFDFKSVDLSKDYKE